MFSSVKLDSRRWGIRSSVPMVQKSGSRISLLSKAMAMLVFSSHLKLVIAHLPDRGRIVSSRKQRGDQTTRSNSRFAGHLPIEGPRYRGRNGEDHERNHESAGKQQNKINNVVDMDKFPGGTTHAASSTENVLRLGDPMTLQRHSSPQSVSVEIDGFGRELSSQLTGCCSTYEGYSAAAMCSLYGQDCTQGGAKSHDSGDENCVTDGLSFIGISFSVNTAHGNPYSYQLNDQFPMENIIDRSYEYIMSMDEDGWLVGGGYKTFDYSGKMPYIDSSHTELLRIGQLDPDKGGTTIQQVYTAMSFIEFAPISIFPEYVKGGGGGHSQDDDDTGSVPSGDVTLIVSVVEVYSDSSAYSDYEIFLDSIFSAMDAVGGGPCMDDHDTDPHVSMARGVKFKSSYHQYQYFYTVNLEVAVWQKMYPNGVVIGSSSSASFPPNTRSKASYVGYGNLYFFFDRANITKAFPPNRDLTSSEMVYSTLLESSSTAQIEAYYSAVTYIPFNWNVQSGSKSDDQEQQNYEHNPYNWKSSMAIHDMTDGWDLPPNCGQEGETFFGIPLAAASESKLQTTSTFQEQFDFDVLCDHNYTYIKDFGTNHGWLLGERLGNGVASIVDKDTAHIPLFYMGTTNANMGGMSITNMIKIAKEIDFGQLFIKPAFVFADDNGHVKLQFEADANSALGYLYDNLCKMMGISWNYNSPSNEYGVYSSCVMHASGDRAAYGCGPENAGTGGFCPQMTIAYSAAFQSDDHAAAYMNRCNNYIDYWRSLYPTGVAVGSEDFCPNGGCLALFLNRYDVYQVFEPDLGGSWVAYNGHTVAPTVSPAPTWSGGCDDPQNMHLDKCFRAHITQKKTSFNAWETLGPVGQMSIVLVTFMASTLTFSVFFVSVRRRKRRDESYVDFFLRDFTGTRIKRKKLKKKKTKKTSALEEHILGDDNYENDEFTLGSRSRPGKTKRPRSSSQSVRSRSQSGRKRGGTARSISSQSKGGRSHGTSRSRDASHGRSRSRGASRSGKSRESASVASSRPRSSSRSRASSRDASRRDKKKNIVPVPSEPEVQRRQLV